MNGAPSPTGINGRDDRGRFGAGNRFAKGNPHAKRVGQLRAMLLDGVEDADWQDIVKRLIDDAKAGDHTARRELFERTLGKPTEHDLIERLEHLEQHLERTGHDKF